MRTILALGVVCLTLAQPARADDWDFVLVNKTGKTIKQVELSPSGSGTWSDWKTEEGRTSEIKPGASYTVHFSRQSDACKFDVRLTFADDTTASAQNLDVCDYAFAEFSFRNEALAMKGN